MAPMIPKRYHMWDYNAQTLTKQSQESKILNMAVTPSFVLEMTFICRILRS